MKGLLVVNSFVKSEKFEDLYGLLENAANARGISLSRRGTALFCAPLGEDFDTDGADFALFWDKDTTLARRLEAQGLRLYNRADAIEACDSKILTAAALQNAKIPHPKTIVAPKLFEGAVTGEFLKNAAQILGFPLVVKEAFGSFGAQVFLVRDFCELENIAAKIGTRPFLLQEFIGTSAGRDVRVNVVGGRAVCAISRENPNDFRSNITNGGAFCQAELSKQWADTALAAAHALKLDFAGVDIMYGADGAPVVCEVNSNPHFRSTLTATGINLAEHIFEHIAERT